MPCLVQRVFFWEQVDHHTMKHIDAYCASYDVDAVAKLFQAYQIESQYKHQRLEYR